MCQFSMANNPSPLSFVRHPLDAILGSVANVRVMRVLLAHGGALSVSRVAGDTSLTPNGARGALHALERAGAIEALGAGRSRLFRAFRGNPVVAALEGLFAAEAARADSILAEVAAATADDAILAAWVYGSVARGTDTPDSDLDVAIILDLPPCEAGAVADAVRERLQKSGEAVGFSPSVIALFPADLGRLRAERAPLWSGLLNDSIVLRGLRPEDVIRRGLLSSRAAPAGVA